jgi:hypothetical protein
MFQTGRTRTLLPKQKQLYPQSHVFDVGRLTIPSIMPAVLVNDGRRQKFLASVIKAGHVDRIEGANWGGQFRAPEDLDATPAAERMLDLARAEPVCSNHFLSLGQQEVIDLHRRPPEAALAADGAIASAGAFGQVQGRDEVNRPAVAASME